jgi:hypothetical protein
MFEVKNKAASNIATLFHFRSFAIPANWLFGLGRKSAEVKIEATKNYTSHTTSLDESVGSS